MYLDLLDRDGALELDAEIPVERNVSVEDFDVYEVDLDRLFPSGRAERNGEDFDLYGDDWELPRRIIELMNEILGYNTLVPAPIGSGHGRPQPLPWDIWAWYQSMHFHGPDWGIYITQNGLIECAKEIAPYCLQGRAPTEQFFKAMLRAAFSVLLLHEQYHHKIESAAIRMHLIQRTPVYPGYWRNVYLPALGTHELLEEGLAGADAYLRLAEPWHRKWIGASSIDGVRRYLEDSFKVAPPGYARAKGLLDRAAFKTEESLLLAAMTEQVMPPSRQHPAEMALATHLTSSLFNIKQNIAVLVPKGEEAIIPVRRPVQPLKRRSLVKYVERRGFTAVKGGKGSHAKYKNAQGQMIIVPECDDVSMRVLQTTAATLGLSMNELRKSI